MEPSDCQFQHEVGQLIQLIPGDSPLKIVGRRAGHFGAVYALEASSGAVTAAKTPRADLSLGRDETDQFVEEALVWTGLPRHPSILPAYRVLSYVGWPYVHMEYIPPINSHGSSVASLLAELPGDKVLNLTAVWTTISHVAQALSHIEKWDPTFIHGDIKPENLLVKVDGGTSGSVIRRGPEATKVNVLLSDFGMACAAASRNRGRTGDLDYLAPEILQTIRERGEYGWAGPGIAVGKPTDMYAIGCTIFKLLYGIPHQLVEPSTGVALYAFGASPPAQKLLVPERPDLRRPFAELVAQCLDSDPERRPQTYADFYARLMDTVEASGGSKRYVPRPMISLPEGYVEATGSEMSEYLVDRYAISVELAAVSLVQMVNVSSLRSLRRMSDSDALLTGLMRRLPDLATLESSHAQNMMIRDENDGARACLRKAISSYEQDSRLAEVDRDGFASACCNLAQLLSAPDSVAFDEALRHAKTALSLRPNSSKIHLARGMALQRAGLIQEASASLAKAREIDPSNALIAEMWLCCEALRMTFWDGAATTAAVARQAFEDVPLSHSEKQRSIRLSILLAKALDIEGKLPKRGEQAWRD